MPKKKIITPANTITGNSNLDQALIKFPEMNNKDALDVALVLQQLVRGQNAILNNLDSTNKNSAELSEQLSKLRIRMDRMDKDAKEFEENQDKFVEKVLSKAEKKKVKGEKKDKLIAKTVVEYKQHVQDQRANLASDILSFEQELARMEVVKVTSPGKLETVMEGGQPTPKLFPEEIRIKHKRWILHPGVPTEVPIIVKEVLEQRRKVEAENAERGKLLQKHMNHDDLANEMANLNKKFNSNSSIRGEETS